MDGGGSFCRDGLRLLGREGLAESRRGRGLVGGEMRWWERRLEVAVSPFLSFLLLPLFIRRVIIYVF